MELVWQGSQHAAFLAEISEEPVIVDFASKELLSRLAGRQLLPPAQAL